MNKEIANPLLESISNALVRWRWLFMFISLLLVASLVAGGKNIGFAMDYEIWFSDNNPELKDLRSLEETYNKTDNVIILIAPKDGEVFTKKTLSHVEWLTEQAWKMPYSIRVDSISNFQYTYASDDDLIVQDLFENSVNYSDKEISSRKQIALNEPLLRNNLISVDKKVTAVNITINIPLDAPQGTSEVMSYSRDLIAQLKNKDPGLELYLTGLVPANNAFFEATQKDMGTLTPLMFGLIIIGLLVFLRSITGALNIIVLIILSILATMGFSGWIGVKLTPVSIAAPTIVMTVMVAHAVHILVSLLYEMRRGMPKRDALIKSLSINLKPVFLATLTTVIGFLSMHFSEVPPFHDLGNMAAMGVTVAFLLAIALLPGLIMIMPMRVTVSEKHKQQNTTVLADFVIKNRNSIFWVLSAFTILISVMAVQNKITEKTWQYFDESIAFRTDTDFASEHLIGPYFMEYSLDSNEKEGISEPAYLKKITEFKAWLMTQPEVIHVHSFSDIIKRLNKNMHADDESWYRIPKDRELSAQYLLLYEMSLPYGLDLTNQINLRKSSTRTMVALHNLSSTDLIEFNSRVKNWLTENVSEMTVTLGSPMYIFAHIGQRATHNMIIGLVIALFVVSIILVLSLRSIKLGILSLVPNLIPPLVAFGIWGMLVGEISVALSLGIGMTIGIIVDDTVHFLSKYLHARRSLGFDAEKAVQYAYTRVGSALLITTAALVAGFMVLATSSFKQNSDLGMITSLAITVALLFDLFLLPVLLLALDSQKTPEETKNIELEASADA